MAVRRERATCVALPACAHSYVRVDEAVTRSPELGTSGSVRGCALKARGILSPEMVTAAMPSSQPRTESCVVIGNEHHEA